MDHDDPGAYLQALLIRPAHDAVAFRNESIGEIGAGFIPIIGERMDLQILVSRDPSVTRVDRAFALGSLAANVLTTTIQELEPGKSERSRRSSAPSSAAGYGRGGEVPCNLVMVSILRGGATTDLSPVIHDGVL